jgi:hypothetical protein
MQIRPNYYSVIINGSLVECLEIIEELGFNFRLGNALKYLWRCGRKGKGINKKIEDLNKAKTYIELEIKSLQNANKLRNFQ